jgi:predicted transcriptional regulator
VKKEKNGSHGLRHAINWLAGEFGVSRTELARRLSHFGQPPYTVRQAFDAWTFKSSREALRERKITAETESAELDAKLKSGQVRKELERMTADHAIRVRQEVEGADYLNAKQRKRLSKALAAIELPKSSI